MGANELANRVEASAWVAAAGQTDGDDIGGPVSADQFFFRSLSGFASRMEIIGAADGDLWDTVTTLTIALFLDRNYARKDTTMVLQPIDSFRSQIGDPTVALPVSYEGPLRVTPLSAAGYQAVKDGGATPFTLPASVDPYSVLLVSANLEDFQVVGKGVEFGIELLRMSDNDGIVTASTFVV